MKALKVRDLMIPLEDYATVSEDATLKEAVSALKEAQETFDLTRYKQDSFDPSRYKHRAVLVQNNRGQVVGKLSQLDIIRGLEPKYFKIKEQDVLERFGYSKEYLLSMMGKYSLWDKPMRDICRKALDIRVKDIMYTPSEGEYVNEDASLDEAIHQLIMGRHQSLLVVSGKKITGVLRLTDVFLEICDSIESCEIQAR